MSDLKRLQTRHKILTRQLDEAKRHARVMNIYITVQVLSWVSALASTFFTPFGMVAVGLLFIIACVTAMNISDDNPWRKVRDVRYAIEDVDEEIMEVYACG